MFDKGGRMVDGEKMKVEKNTEKISLMEVELCCYVLNWRIGWSLRWDSVGERKKRKNCEGDVFVVATDEEKRVMLCWSCTCVEEEEEDLCTLFINNNFLMEMRKRGV